jgi:glycosyltransferase involved in cell wall biosynthesis
MRILVLPKSSNPYQTMLYGPLRDKVSVSYGKVGYKIGYLYPWVLFQERMRGAKILHVHWPYWLTIHLKNRQMRLFITKINIYTFLGISRLLGYKMIRTMHNLLPHEEQTTNDIQIARAFAKFARRTIVHSSETTDQMANLHIDTSKNVIIPIGSYEDIYTDDISSLEARKRLGIHKEEFVILFFGIIRDYKGVDDIRKAQPKKCPINYRRHL